MPEHIPRTFTVRNIIDDSRITDLGSLASYNLILENNLSNVKGHITFALELYKIFGTICEFGR